jgi:hypothetical protein
MASTVKVPLLGTHSKGTVVGVTIGGFAVAGYMIYRYQQKQRAQASAVANSQATSGYGYGSTPYGYGAGAYYGYGEPGIGYGYGSYYGYGVPQPPAAQSVTPSTNAQWAQAAINQLSQEGYNPMAVSSALGAYELGQPVNASQVNIVQAAIGIEGYPPVPGPNDFPPNIKHEGTPGGGGGGGQGGKVSVPKITGLGGEEARDLLQTAGLKDAQIPAKTPQGKRTRVTSQTPSAGKRVNTGSTVTVHVATL